MSNQNDHHFVPKAYLKKFLDTEKLWVLDVELSKKYQNVFAQAKTTSQICYKEFFYLIDESFKVRNPRYVELKPLFVEQEVFKRIENNYDNIFEQITKNEILKIDWLHIVTDFILQIKLRNPFYRAEINNRRGKIVNSIKQQLSQDDYYKQRFGHIPAVVKDKVFSLYISHEGNEEFFGKSLQLSSLIDREFTERKDIVKDAIMSANWQLLDGYYSNVPFITSDNPGVSVTTPFDGLYYNTRFIGNFKFYLPLSPRYSLLIKGGPSDIDFYYTSKKRISRHYVDHLAVVAINDCIMQNYNKYIISSSRSYLNKVAELNRQKS